MSKEASAIYAKLFFSLTQRWADTATFRKLAELGLPYAASHLAADNLRFSHSFMSDPENERLFRDKAQALEALGGLQGMGNAMTKNQLKAFRSAVDSASLIFMHSAVDAASYDLCRVSVMLAPEDWERFIRNVKVTVGDLKAADYDAIMKQKLGDHLAALERESLLKKVDRLFEVCKPPPGFAPKSDYKYDRKKLERLDGLRHEVIHGDTLGSPVPEVAESLEFLFGTGLFLFAMVNNSYDVKLDPYYLVKSQARKDGPPS